MEGTKELITTDDIRSKVYIIRGQQVMLDKDLAELYGYEVKRLNEQVKRNISRFPEDFMFQLNKEEIPEKFSKSQIATFERKRAIGRVPILKKCRLRLQNREFICLLRYSRRIS